MLFNEIVELDSYPISNLEFSRHCKEKLDKFGALILPDFISQQAIVQMIAEGEEKKHLAYYSKNDHNVYLKPSDSNYDESHPRNQTVQSSKGCITDDQVADESPLRTLYDSNALREFLAKVLGEEQLYNYADPLSSINLHYADKGQELGWHFDESSFAVTLLLQSPEAGGQFEYVENIRDADAGEMNYNGVAEVLSGDQQPKILKVKPGTLALFRGRNAIHRVTPTQGDKTRMLVVLAYNAQQNVSLSESARMTFYGRL